DSLDLPAVVGPLQQRLALAPAAAEVAGIAVLLHLPQVPAHRLPAADLAAILLGHPAAHVVAAVPLEPAAGIVRMDPAFAAPFRERLARGDAEEVERGIAPPRRELGAAEPVGRKLAPRVGHV